MSKRKSELFVPILMALIMVSCVGLIAPDAMAQQPIVNSVSSYSITNVVQTGLSEISVMVRCTFCSACLSNSGSAAGCTAFEHTIPPYGSRSCTHGRPSGRYAAVRVKDKNGNVLGSNKMVCNPSNWPLNVLHSEQFVLSGLTIHAGDLVTVEADFYCSLCGHWYPNPVSLTVIGSNSAVSYFGDTEAMAGTTADVKAQLTDKSTGSPLAGQTITFTLDSLPAVSDVTDANGVAETTIAIPAGTAGGTYPIVARFTGNASYYPSSDTKDFTVVVNRPPIVICCGTVTEECTCFEGDNASVTADVADPDGDQLTAKWYVDGILAKTDTVPGATPVTSARIQLSQVFSLGTHTVKVVVSDGEESVDCTTQVVVRDTTPPQILSCVGPKLLYSEFGALVPLPDFTGELVACDIADPSPNVVQDPLAGFMLSLGFTDIKYTVCDRSGNEISCICPVEVQLANHPPDCSKAYPSISKIWPPSSTKLVPVTIKGVTDPDGDPIKITITSIFQDEPTRGQCTGDLSPDGFGIGTNTAKVRAERGTKGNGRVYTIGFIAEDPRGASCTNFVKVCVPRSVFPYYVCVDGGPIYDSTRR